MAGRTDAILQVQGLSINGQNNSKDITIGGTCVKIFFCFEKCPQKQLLEMVLDLTVRKSNCP